ncbi:hypothetical protein, partial [Variovorax sp. 22077]|uniref:hypothetical protein n=1 Tax=Variovorax sp. 22077 TaxID=3453867 RepID=UPI003F834301
VPTFTCGLVRVNLPFAIFQSLKEQSRVLVLCLHPVAGSPRTGTGRHRIADRKGRAVRGPWFF